MSTFGGKIQEIPEISVDRFDGDNLKSEAFFLSHCHSDHMRGLNDYFFDQLIESNRYLYASEISCKILEKKYPALNLKPLSPYLPTDVCLQEKHISVISIPAGHCPGSLMFLFECGTRILYTGDYRIHKHDIKKMKGFYNSLNEVKVIDKIYLDTTFFSKMYPQFPTREQSLRELCRIIQNIIDTGDPALIHIKTGAFYGYEYCFKEIYDRFNMPVHVNSNSYECYRYIPDMDKCVTLDGSITKIHSSCGGYKKICNNFSEVHHIYLTAMRWTEEKQTDRGISVYEQGSHFVCYSTHASYEEGVALLTFLNPKQVEMCVVDEENDENNLELERLVNSTINKIKFEHIPKVKPKFFKETSFERKSKAVKTEWHDDLEVLKSPTRVRKKIRWSRSEEIKTVKIEQEIEDCKAKSLELGVDNLEKKTVDREDANISLEDSDKSTINKETFNGNLLDILDLNSPENNVKDNQQTPDKQNYSSSNSDDSKSFYLLNKPLVYYGIEGINLPSTSFALDEDIHLTPENEKLIQNNSLNKNIDGTSSDSKQDSFSQNSDDNSIILGIINNTVKKSLDFDVEDVEMFEDDSENDILRDIIDFKPNR